MIKNITDYISKLIIGEEKLNLRFLSKMYIGMLLLFMVDLENGLFTKIMNDININLVLIGNVFVVCIEIGLIIGLITSFPYVLAFIIYIVGLLIKFYYFLMHNPQKFSWHSFVLKQVHWRVQKFKILNSIMYQILFIGLLIINREFALESLQTYYSIFQQLFSGLIIACFVEGFYCVIALISMFLIVIKTLFPYNNPNE